MAVCDIQFLAVSVPIYRWLPSATQFIAMVDPSRMSVCPVQGLIEGAEGAKCMKETDFTQINT